MTDDRAVKAACRQWLSQHRPAAPAEVLAPLAGHPASRLDADVYGSGGAVAELERRTIALLGKPAGLFFIKGVTAQLAVLAACAEARGTRTVAVPALSHLQLDEAGAIARVGGLTPIPLGRHQPFGVAELAAIRAPLAAVVVELPLRRAGYLLPPLGELEAIAAWCRAEGVPLHFDGARLWEAAAGYGIDLDELAAMADSVYVSFYKGLGGLGGALVAGRSETIEALKPWKTRLGGDLYTAWPQAISGLIGLDDHLGRMPDYVRRARDLAASIGAVDGVQLHPAAPHTNGFQLWLRGTPEALAARHRAFAEQHRVWLFNAFQPAPLDGWSMAEIVIGDASDDWTVDQAKAWIAEFARG
ncbi:MAG: threonine aldolase family protein [Sphingomonas sp.]